MHEFIAHYSYLVLLAKKVVDLVYSVVVDLGESGFCFSLTISAPE